MKTRKMKVYYAYLNNKQLPFIRLNGNWLKECNFAVGDEIEISCCNEFLLIRKVIKKNKEK